MDRLVERVLELAVVVQQIPAPTFYEARRADFMQQVFLDEGLVDVEIDLAGNVLGRRPGTGGALPVVVSAHLDNVFPQDTDLSVSREKERISGAGIGDNAIGVASLLGLLWGLQERYMYLPGNLWLVANVGEEGLGNLKGMRAIVERFQAKTAAYLVLEGMSLDNVYNRGLCVRRYRIEASTAGGHAWVDYGKPSAIHALAEVVCRITALQLPEKPRASLNVGIFHGGTSINTIAGQAYFELDVRSEDCEGLESLASQVERITNNANISGVQINIEVIGERPAGHIPADHPLVRLAVSSLEAQGRNATLTAGSTDANLPLSLGLPAVCIGITTGGEAHTCREYIDTQPVGRGLERLITLVQGIYKEINTG